MSVDVLVLGGSMPGVVAAIECAKLGLKVTMAFTELEAPSSRVTDTEGGWARLIAELDMPELTPVPMTQPWVRGVKGEAVPVLNESVLGIPSSPLAAEVVAGIGRSAATRAYLDRVKPVLTIGKERRLAGLVKSRMGAAVLNTLVEPLVFERFGATADQVDVAIAAPGLNEAITRTGSLSTGVLATYAELAEGMRTVAMPAPDILSDAVMAKLEYWNIQVVNINPADVNVNDAEWSHRALILAGSPELANRTLHLSAMDFNGVAVRSARRVTILTDAPVGFCATAMAANGERWSVAVIATVGDAQLIELKGPREVRSFSDDVASDAIIDDLSAAQVRLLLTEVGIVPTGELSFVEATVEFAPFTQLEEEHAREGILAVLDERDDVSVVGPWLNQGNESKSLVTAAQQAQTLRRRLIGLS